MTITISESSYLEHGDRLKVSYSGRHKISFINRFREDFYCKRSELFNTMWVIADWANNEMNEECIFEIE